MARPRKVVRPSRPDPDLNIYRRTRSKDSRSSLIRHQIKTDPAAPDISLTSRELDRILEVVPHLGPFGPDGFELIDNEEFESRIEKCISGYAISRNWQQILRWSLLDIQTLNRLKGIAEDLQKEASKLSPAADHLLQYVRGARFLSKLRILNFSTNMLEELTVACNQAPLPDRGRSSDIGIRFITLELADIWQAYTGEEPRRSQKRKPGEFGMMVERVIEILQEREFVQAESASELLNKIITGIDRTKFRRKL